MFTFPAITILASCNAILLIAIMLAPLVRRRTRVQLAAREAPTFHRPVSPLPQNVFAALEDPDPELRFAAARTIATGRGPNDEVELCRILTRLDVQTSRVLLAALSRRGEAPANVLAMAADSRAGDRVGAIRLLGTTGDPRVRRTLAMLLDDRDVTIRRESAAASAASARVDFPRPLDPVLVDRLLRALDEEPGHALTADVIDALTYSLDPRVPAAFLRYIPSSRDSVRERLVESSALFAHLVQAADRRRAAERP